MSFFEIRSEHQQQFEREGYVIAKQLFSPTEIERLSQYARADRAIAAGATCAPMRRAARRHGR
ncbi:MAG: hypothetical protein R3C56_00800 [Pirellulaceae bacterium]